MYAKYGSGYSFWLGLKQAFDYETSEIVFTIPSVGVKIRFVFTLKNTPIAVMNIVIIKQITLKYKLNDNVGIIKSYKSVNQPKANDNGISKIKVTVIFLDKIH